MREVVVARLNPNQFMSESGWDFAPSWSGYMDVSVWLKPKIAQSSRIYLMAEVTDSQSRKVISVDRCMPQTTSAILLNGRVKIAGKGRISELKLIAKYESCIEADLKIEDVYVKPVTSSVLSTQLLSRRAG